MPLPETSSGRVGPTPCVPSRPPRPCGGNGWLIPLFPIPLLLLAILLPSSLASQEGNLEFLDEWRWVDFDRETGYLGHRVREMVEVGDTLWVLSDVGPFWYGGFHWHGVGAGEGLPRGVPGAMAPGLDGSVLLVSAGAVYRGGTEGFFPVSPGDWEGEGLHIRDVAESPEGLLVGASDRERGEARFFLWTGDLVREVTPPGTVAEGWRLRGMSSGQVFLRTDMGLLRWEEDRWTLFLETQGYGFKCPTVHEMEDGSGFTFGNLPQQGWRMVLWDSTGEIRTVAGEGDDRVSSGIRTRDGQVWLVYETEDIRLLTEDGWRTPALPRWRTSGLHQVFEDSHGDLWLASARGLHLYRRSLDRWSSIRFPFPDSRNRINDLLVTRSGDLWMATGGGVYRRSRDGSERWIDWVLGEELGAVTGLAEDGEGGIWITSGATFSGAFRFLDGRWRRMGPDQGVPRIRIHRPVLARGGGIWLTGLGVSLEHDSAGAFLWKEDGSEEWMDERGWLEERTYAIAEGPDGAVWFGTHRGLLRYEKGRWSYWWGAQLLDGTPGRRARVFTILPEADGGALVGFGPLREQGIRRVLPDGSVVDPSQEAGLVGASVLEIVRGPGGDTWVSSDRGVARRSQGEWFLVDGVMGLEPAAAWPLAFREGEVLIGTTGGGLQILNRAEEEAPAPRILPWGEITTMGKSIRIQFRVASYRGGIPQDRIQVRDQLPGRVWSNWGTYREIRTTPEDDFGYGRKTILLKAKGLFGRVLEVQELRIRIPPPVHLRPIFYLPVSFMAVLLLGLWVANKARRRRAEASIREREATFRALVESAPEGIAIYDADADRFTDVNVNVLSLTGFSKMDFLESRLGGTSPTVLEDGRTGREYLLEQVERALAGETVTFEWAAVGSPGPPIPVEMRLARLPSEKGRLVRFSVLDIRDRKAAEDRRQELEAQLRQSQKLEAVGQLTGGVAHDFNNLLTVIMGNLDLLRESEPGEDGSRDLIDGALGAAERSALLTQRLLAFSRRQTLDPRPLKLTHLVEGLIPLLQRSLGETIRIHPHVPDETWTVEADAGQLEHAVINLAVNARDAMGSGGDLYLEGTNVVVEENAAEKWGGAPGEYVSLSVTDTGTGMPPEIRERAIDPFFTTKEVGAGSGLGLSMVYGFMKQSGGFIKIHSDLGKGTSVQLFLPRAHEGAAEMGRRRRRMGEAPEGAGEVILVVEDEPLLLKLSANLCTRLGYEVVPAPDAEVALEILRSEDRVDLVFTDMVLPGGTDGVQLALEAASIRPGVPFLFTSGYAEQFVLRMAERLPEFELIPKPFDSGALARKIRAALDGRRARPS